MASGLPCIATNWGGPADYLDPSCGILVEPTDERSLIAGFARAMKQLELDPALRAQLGTAARRRIIDGAFDWDTKIDRMLEVYQSARHRSVEDPAIQD
jgi:glycosyltransferase involved in cell wall biosynthesis